MVPLVELGKAVRVTFASSPPPPPPSGSARFKTRTLPSPHATATLRGSSGSSAPWYANPPRPVTCHIFPRVFTFQHEIVRSKEMVTATPRRDTLIPKTVFECPSPANAPGACCVAGLFPKSDTPGQLVRGFSSPPPRSPPVATPNKSSSRETSQQSNSPPWLATTSRATSAVFSVSVSSRVRAPSISSPSPPAHHASATHSRPRCCSETCPPHLGSTKVRRKLVRSPSQVHSVTHLSRDPTAKTQTPRRCLFETIRVPKDAAVVPSVLSSVLSCVCVPSSFVSSSFVSSEPAFIVCTTGSHTRHCTSAGRAGSLFGGALASTSATARAPDWWPIATSFGAVAFRLIATVNTGELSRECSARIGLCCVSFASLPVPVPVPVPPPLFVVAAPNLHTKHFPPRSPETHKSGTIGDMDNALTSVQCPRNTLRHRNESVSHKRRLVSAEPDTSKCATPRWRPKPNAVTRLVWPTRVPTNRRHAPCVSSGRTMTTALRAAYAYRVPSAPPQSPSADPYQFGAGGIAIEDSRPVAIGTGPPPPARASTGE